MQEKRKLLFLMPSLAGGGAERTLINLLHKLDYSMYAVDLVLVLNKGPYISHVPVNVQIIHLFKHEFLVRVLAWLQKKVGFTYLLKSQTQKRVKGSYDVGISFLDGNFTDLLFFIPGLKRRITWVHSSYKSYRNFARFYENKNYRDKLKRERYGKLDGIYFVSHDSMNEFIEVFGRYPEMRVVYNLIDSAAVVKKSEQLQYPKGEQFQFVALGSLLPVKGFDRLIRSAKLIKEQVWEFKIIIAGAGPEEQRLKNMVSEFNLNSTVEFVGFLSNPYPLLKVSDVFVMSSESEALPTVLCEAMILGKPTLVTNCSGCRELVDNGIFGVMAEQDDLNLANKMIEFLSKPELLKYYHNKSLERALLFDDNQVLAEYEKILNQN